MNKTRYIFVTGGVTSSLGKGIISASLARLLQARGYSVTIQKLDPYINIDPGTLNPYEHGECFVTDDGAETDLDLGHYERFLNISTSQANSVTTGRVYQSVIDKERRGDFNGMTVQVIPHITDEIKNRIKILGNTGKYDFVITEIGGTVGDIESLPYIEAVRQMRWELHNECVMIHLTLVPYLAAAGELKTKPTQHSVKMLQEQGVQPDIIVCRTSHHMTQSMRNKISLFCNVPPTAVIESIDAPSIYDVPFLMVGEGLDKEVLRKFSLPFEQDPDLTDWKHFLDHVKHPGKTVDIALVGKYVELKDSYKSIIEAFIHAGAVNNCKVKLKMIQSEHIKKENVDEKLKDVSAILVAPGSGSRGVEGKIETIRYARERKIPFFGICLGMQCAVIEFARNVLGYADANSVEFNSETKHPVINLMEEQKRTLGMDETMRLGSYPCYIKQGSKAYEAYCIDLVSERHRHRHEFNNDYSEVFTQVGMKLSGVNKRENLVEIIELENHPWFIATQFHPEYKSTVIKPHPLFVRFVAEAVKQKERQEKI
jgi:CTP synthase